MIYIYFSLTFQFRKYSKRRLFNPLSEILPFLRLFLKMHKLHFQELAQFMVHVPPSIIHLAASADTHWSDLQLPDPAGFLCAAVLIHFHNSQPLSGCSIMHFLSKQLGEQNHRALLTNTCIITSHLRGYIAFPVIHYYYSQCHANGRWHVWYNGSLILPTGPLIFPIYKMEPKLAFLHQT